MTYSISVRPYNDPYIAIAEEAIVALAELSKAGAFLVDILPILKYVPDWFPGAKFHRKAAMMRTQSDRIRNAPFAETKKLMVFTPWLFLWSNSDSLMTPAQANGDNDPSFVSEALREIEHSDNPNQDVELLKDVAAMAYVGESALCLLSFLLGQRSVTPAGADTTASALGTFFLAMVCYPQVQKKAQEELDKVFSGRLPEHSDIDSLPYLSALVKEVYRYGRVCFKDSLPHARHASASYRWQPVLPIGRPLFSSQTVLSSMSLSRQGVPHQLTSDDLYNDYHIPANSIVIPNQW